MHRVTLLLYILRAVKTQEFISICSDCDALLAAVAQCTGRRPEPRARGFGPGCSGEEKGEREIRWTPEGVKNPLK